MGKTEPIEIIEIIDFEYNSNQNKNTLKMLEYFNKAMSYYNEYDWEQAIKIFEKSNRLEVHKEHNPSMLFINRCQKFFKNPPSNWNGIFKLESK